MSKARGKSGSLTQDQLQALGCIGKDIPAVATAPPATFPPLMTRPVPFEMSAEQDYKLLCKELFLNHMRDSPYYLTRKTIQNVQRYSDQYASLLENTLEKSNFNFPNDLLPNELKNIAKRKRSLKNRQSSSTNIVKKPKSVEDCLKILEQKEEQKVLETKEKGSDSEMEEQEHEMEDDEMDDENDYGNNYFDNGEAFNEEDDNLDDGPIY